MSERVKKLIENAREAFKATHQDAHGFTLPGYTAGAHFFAVLDVLSDEVDALSQELATHVQIQVAHRLVYWPLTPKDSPPAARMEPAPAEPADTIDWKRKYEAFQEVHNEVHAVLAKAGPEIHDLANKGHAYAIEALIAQRDAVQRDRGETKSVLAHSNRRGLELANAVRGLLRTRGPSYATVTVGTKELDALYAVLVEYETGGQP